MLRFAALLALLLLSLAADRTAGAESTPAPIIDVYTIGPGDYLLSRLGHVAVCVTDEESPAGRCYNWGTTDFDALAPVTIWQVIRGQAKFWVAQQSKPDMLADYIREDRSIYRQRLPLTKEAAQHMVQALSAASRGDAKFYNYQHFRDNCSTRVRDLLNSELGGRLRGDSPELRAASEPPIRRTVNEGVRPDPMSLGMSELLVGRNIDKPATRWERMLFPAVLRAEIESRLGVPPVQEYARQLPPSALGSYSGAAFLASLGVILALVAFLAGRQGRPQLGQALVGGVLGFFGLLIALTAIASPHAELRNNEVLLILSPVDLALVFLPARYVIRYLLVRGVGLLLCALAFALGWLIQPLWGPLLFCALPFGTMLALTIRGRARPSIGTAPGRA